jgi:hypothetical protein
MHIRQPKKKMANLGPIGPNLDVVDANVRHSHLKEWRATSAQARHCTIMAQFGLQVQSMQLSWHHGLLGWHWRGHYGLARGVIHVKYVCRSCTPRWSKKGSHRPKWPHRGPHGVKVCVIMILTNKKVQAGHWLWVSHSKK